MPTSRKPRKAHRPRLINPPMTEGLVQMFRETLTTAEIGLRLAAPTLDHFDALAAALNVIGPVVARQHGEHSEAAIALQSAALHMNSMIDRRSHGDAPQPLPVELAAVSRGVDAALAALGTLSVRDLYLSHLKLLRGR